MPEAGIIRSALELMGIETKKTNSKMPSAFQILRRLKHKCSVR
jgi:hypothetical protein